MQHNHFPTFTPYHKRKAAVEAETTMFKSEEKAVGAGNEEGFEEEKSGDNESALGSDEEEANEDIIKKLSAKKESDLVARRRLIDFLRTDGHCMG